MVVNNIGDYIFSFLRNKRLFGFILLYIIPYISCASGGNITLFNCDESNWKDFAVYTQTQNAEVHTCLLNEIKTQGKRYLERPYNCYFYIAQACYYQTNYGSSTHYAQQALNATNKPEDSTRALLLLARTCRANDKISEAQNYTLQALYIAQRTLEEDRAYAYIELARINYTLKDSLNATQYLDRAGNIVENVQNPNLKGAYYYQKARVQYWYEGTTDLDEVITQLLKSLEYSESAENYAQIATTLDFLGSCYWRKAAYKEAKEYYEKGLEVKNMMGDIYGQAMLYNNLASLSYMQDMEANIPEAIQYFKKSAKLSEKIDAFELLKATYGNIAAMYEQNKHPDSTIAYFRKTMAVMDTLKLRQREDLIYDLQTQYETREKEQQIKAQKQQLSYLGLSAGLLALVAGLIYFLYRQKSRLNTIITGQKEELEKLNSFKNQLFSIMGHDLRGMMSKLNMSQRKMVRVQAKQGDDDMKAPVSKMGAIIDGLNGFIENILYWGFSQTNRLHFTYENINVDSVVEQVAYNFKYDLEHKNITLKKDMSDDFSVYADLNTIKVVIRNLLANAIKYSDADGEITIRGIIGNPNRLIQVIDEGQGIPPEKIPILFAVNNEKVTRGTAGEKGTGLGLWLCKEMMEKNKGTIEVESRVGKGTIFTLHFPTG